MKLLSLIFFLFISLSANASGPEGTFGMHLFFDEREFIDVLTITKGESGTLKGHMHVPDDFDGEISALQVEGSRMSFDLFVPKNNSRPQDLIFSYYLFFVGGKLDKFHGYATLKGKTDFLASFVGFRRKNL